MNSSVQGTLVLKEKILLQGPVPFGKKEITIREWKGKDRKAFKKLISETPTEELSEDKIAQTLVYDCIEEDVVLNPYELKYILGKIRSISISDDIKFIWTCSNPECDHQNTSDLKISEIYKPIVFDGIDVPEFKLNGLEVKFQNVKNTKFYKTAIAETNLEVFLVDMALHIKSIGQNEAWTLQQILDYFDEECSIKELDDLWNNYRKCMFKLEDTVELECTECKQKQAYKFDEIPGFFPGTWFI